MNSNSIHLHVSDKEIEERKKQVVKPKKMVEGSLLAYRKGVSGSEKGAVWLYGE